MPGFLKSPYRDLSSLLETTRELDPEEMAELQLELGYADRALSIYEELLAREPNNAHYVRRRAWLSRLATAKVRTIQKVGVHESSAEAPTPAPRPRKTTRPGSPAWRAEPWRGETWRGETWRGEARRGEARRGEARRGEARGGTWRGMLAPVSTPDEVIPCEVDDAVEETIVRRIVRVGR